MKNATALLLTLLAIQLSFSQSVDSPEIEVSPESFSETLLTGGTSSQVLTISNNGDSTLNFEISIEYLANEEYQNYAIEFDGMNDEVNMGYSSLLDVEGDLTICLWYRTESIYWGALVCNYDQYNPDNGYELCSSSLYDWGGFVYFECAYNNTRDGYSSNAIFNDGEWHHIAAIYTPDGFSNGQVYVDGIEQPGTFLGSAIPAIGATPDYDFKVGAAYSEAFFEGAIDEVSIWDKALTEQEIQENMNWELLGSETGLVGYWKFNEGTGDLTSDASLNNNDGTLINNPSWIISGAPVLPRQWLSVESDSGQVAAGNSTNLNVGFDASGLADGSYYAEIIIQSNDPLNQEIVIPVQLDVISAPDIQISTDTLDFGGVFLGDSLAVPFMISNIGFEPLEVTNISCADPEFMNDTSYFTLNPGGSFEINLMFLPSAEMAFESVLTISSNDPDHPTILVTLLGDGILPPLVHVEPDSLSETLYAGKSSTQTLSIFNTGYSNLNWETTLQNTGLNTLTFTKEDWTDWTEPENQDCITPNVCITRNNFQGIFNAQVESGYNYGSPEDTEWSFGYSSDLQPEDYDIWVVATNYSPPSMVNQPMSVHLISDDIYFDILFHSWTSGGNGGGFSYTRSSMFPIWFDLSQQNGVIAPDSSFDAEAIFNASYLDAGEYDGTFSIITNDPLNPVVSIPLHLEVIDAPSIYTTMDTLDFGSLFTGLENTMELTIENTGSLDLFIFSAEADLDVYSIFPPYASIDPGETELFTVVFSPDTVGDFSGTLTFNNNDPLTPELLVVLNGIGIEPPIISISPDSLNVDILSGQTMTNSFTISNSGASDLFFDINPGESSQNFALEFDGYDDYVEVGDEINIANNSFTLEAWAQRTNSGFSHFLFGQGTFYSNQGLHIGFRENNVFTFAFYSDDLNSPDTYTDFDWHHWACTYDATTQARKIYRDGIEVAADFANGNYTGSGSLYIGITAWYNDYFDGNIDEARIWNDVRTQEEIQMGMNIEVPGNENGLIACWSFNEGDGPTAYDKTVFGNHGTLQNGVAWTNSTAPILPFWLSVLPQSGTIQAGSFLDINAIFNADNLLGGDYLTTIYIENNDPLTPQLDIPVHMHVTGASSITTPTDTLNFGQVFINYTDTLILEVQNVGSDDLIIADVLTDPSEFGVLPATASIEPGQNFFFSVSFSPILPQVYPGTLTFLTNDPLQEEYVVYLYGEGLDIPVILVSPDSIFQQLMTGDTASQVLEIINSGAGELVFTVAQQSNHSLEFDGIDDHCFIPNSTSLNIGTNAVTLELWAKLYELPSSISGSFSGLYDSNNDAYVLYEDKGNQELRFKITDNTGTAERPGIPEEEIPLNEWIHIAGVYDGTAEEARIYLNGELKDTHSNPSLHDNVRPGQVASFGAEAGESKFLNGMIDDCRIWSTARTQEEINAFRFEELTGLEPGLVSYWNFNEGEGDTAHDLNVNGNDGTISGGILWTNDGPPTTPDWLVISPDSGICSPNSMEYLSVFFDANDLEPGNYQSDIQVLSNDPATPEAIILVHLEVTEIVEIPTFEDPNSNIQLTIYPNPCAGATTIKISNNEHQRMILEVFDISGVKIKKLMNKVKMPGIYEMDVDVSDLPAGVYYCVLKTESGTYANKLIKL